MTEVPNNQLQKISRLASLLTGVVNKAMDCAIILRRGFIEPIDAAATRKAIKNLQAEISKIDAEADEMLNGVDSSVEPPSTQTADNDD